MVRMRIELDATAFDRLLDEAIAEARSAPRQAEVILRRALGLPFPYRTSLCGQNTHPRPDAGVSANEAQNQSKGGQYAQPAN